MYYPTLSLLIEEVRNVILEIQRAVALGSKYGLKAIPMFADASVETPQIDETANSGAIGIVVTLAATLIALYITILVVGSMSNTATTAIALPAAYNTTLTALDSNSNASFSLAGILPIAIVGVGVLVVIISAFSFQ